MFINAIHQWDQKKNLFLRLTRGVGFEEVIEAVKKGKLLDIIENPNQEKYPRQGMYVIKIQGYAYIAPFVIQGPIVRLITVYPSRKVSKQYGLLIKGE